VARFVPAAQAGRVERSEKEATSFSGPQMNVLFRFFEVSSGKSEISDILKSDQLGKHAFLWTWPRRRCVRTLFCTSANRMSAKFVRLKETDHGQARIN